MERICAHPFTRRPLTKEDLDDIILLVGDGREEFAVIEASDGSCLQFIPGEEASTFHVESLVDAKPYVPPGNADMAAEELRALLQRYIDGQPMDVLTADWVLFKEQPKGVSNALVIGVFVLVVALVLYWSA